MFLLERQLELQAMKAISCAVHTVQMQIGQQCQQGKVQELQMPQGRSMATLIP